MIIHHKSFQITFFVIKALTKGKIYTNACSGFVIKSPWLNASFRVIFTSADCTIIVLLDKIDYDISEGMD